MEKDDIEKVRAYSILVKKYAVVFFDMVESHDMAVYEDTIKELLAEFAIVEAAAAGAPSVVEKLMAVNTVCKCIDTMSDKDKIELRDKLFPTQTQLTIDGDSAKAMFDAASHGYVYFEQALKNLLNITVQR